MQIIISMRKREDPLFADRVRIGIVRISYEIDTEKMFIGEGNNLVDGACV